MLCLESACGTTTSCGKKPFRNAIDTYRCRTTKHTCGVSSVDKGEKSAAPPSTSAESCREKRFRDWSQVEKSALLFVRLQTRCFLLRWCLKDQSTMCESVLAVEDVPRSWGSPSREHFFWDVLSLRNRFIKIFKIFKKFQSEHNPKKSKLSSC